MWEGGSVYNKLWRNRRQMSSINNWEKMISIMICEIYSLNTVCKKDNIIKKCSTFLCTTKSPKISNLYSRSSLLQRLHSCNLFALYWFFLPLYYLLGDVGNVHFSSQYLLFGLNELSIHLDYLIVDDTCQIQKFCLTNIYVLCNFL